MAFYNPEHFAVERPTAVCDTECYPNYWAIAFREVGGAERVRVFERRPNQPLDRERLTALLRRWRIVTFNGINYDMPMLALALIGASNAVLKEANDEIIMGQLRPWQFEQRYGVTLPAYVDHVDVMEVSPGSPAKPSLKLYAGRLHSYRMQELPLDPGRPLDDLDIKRLRSYHLNDLEVTRDLYLELKPQIDLREQLSREYQVDLRSKSDAQVAEAVIKAAIERRTGERVYKPDIKPGAFNFRAPPYIRFRSGQLRALLATVERAAFRVYADGRVHPPPELENGIKVDIGQARYKVGIGGLHSQEKRTSWVSDDDYVLLDRDVTSYYPRVILGGRLAPEHLGDLFLLVYRDIYRRRLAAKERGDKNVAETLKIVLNGSFGKFGSPYSALYSPNLMIQTTMTGQIAALMLIERLEAAGIQVVSANTDGVVSRVPRALREVYERIVLDWETETGFLTEETEYLALHSRDVNNYVAITPEGKVKTKGTFGACGAGLPGAAGMKKNPDSAIVADAVVAWLKDGTPLERTIRACTDVRRFVTVRRVNGGAQKDGVPIGKAVRWYMALGERGAITYQNNGNAVPKTEGAKPCLQLPDEFPLDLDHDWYIRQAYATLDDLGLDGVTDPGLVGRTGRVYARLPDQTTWHIVTLPSGVALCGRRPASIREPWQEASAIGGQRMCSKCQSLALEWAVA